MVTAKPAFCASCTEERADLTRRGLVYLCPDCDPDVDTRTAVRLGPERGYDVPDRDPGRGRTVDRFRDAADRVAPMLESGFRRWHGEEPTPGFVRIVVARQTSDGVLDREEARQTLSHEPWFAEVRHIGTNARHHVFERPDVQAAAAARRETDYDPIAALARLSGGRR